MLEHLAADDGGEWASRERQRRYVASNYPHDRTRGIRPGGAAHVFHEGCRFFESGHAVAARREGPAERTATGAGVEHSRCCLAGQAGGLLHSGEVARQQARHQADAKAVPRAD